MKNVATNLGITLTKDELLKLRNDGAERRQMAIASANAKGRKLGYLGVEYTQRQRSQFLSNVSSEDIASALADAGKIAIFKRTSDQAICFAWIDEDGSVPEQADNMPVQEVEKLVREYLENQAPEAPVKKARK